MQLSKIRGEVRSAGFRAAGLALFLLPATMVFPAGCGSPKAAPPVPSPEVEVARVAQKDVPIYSEWVATLDGYVNGQIQPQVPGYVTVSAANMANTAASRFLNQRPFLNDCYREE